MTGPGEKWWDIVPKDSMIDNLMTELQSKLFELFLKPMGNMTDFSNKKWHA